MTHTRLIKKYIFSMATVIMLIFAFVLSLSFSGRIAHSVKSGLSLCANVIIPSVFPFIIISDFLYTFIDFSSLKFIGDCFEKLFKINRAGLYAFILGILCGFPLGVKCASELYLSGELERDEAERLIGFSNNTGPAFLVSGIGLGLRGNIRDGIFLYSSMLISSILTGIIFSIGKKKSPGELSPVCSRRFSITESIKNAGTNTLSICAFLTFFACIAGLLRAALGECPLYLSIIPFLEVGSASSILSKTKLLSPPVSLSLTSFAVGFSGFSVHLQALSFLSKTDLSTKRYFLMKFIQGLLSILIIVPLYIFFS